MDEHYNKIKQLRELFTETKKRHVEELDAIRELIYKEQDKITMANSKMPTIENDIVDFLRSEYTSESLSSVACDVVYAGYIRHTKHYKDLTRGRFSRRLSKIGVTTSTAYMNGGYVRVYEKST